MINKTSCISINALELEVFLGWPDQERLQKQKVFLDIGLRFIAVPDAENTDNLQDTVCYDTLISQIKTFIQEKSFRLLEYFTAQIYQVIKQHIPHTVLLNLRVTKNPAIAQLTGGVTYSYEEFAW